MKGQVAWELPYGLGFDLEFRNYTVSFLGM